MTSDAPAPRPRAVVVAHGELAAGMVSAVEQITGKGALFVAVSNAGLGLEELEERIAGHVVAGAHVVFTDLPAGSTTLASRRLQRTHPEVVVVTGVSLPALLAFALAADKGDAEAAQAAAEKAKAALQVAGGAARAAGG